MTNPPKSPTDLETIDQLDSEEYAQVLARIRTKRLTAGTDNCVITVAPGLERIDGLGGATYRRYEI